MENPSFTEDVFLPLGMVPFSLLIAISASDRWSNRMNPTLFDAPWKTKATEIIQWPELRKRRLLWKQQHAGYWLTLIVSTCFRIGKNFRRNDTTKISKEILKFLLCDRMWEIWNIKIGKFDWLRRGTSKRNLKSNQKKRNQTNNQNHSWTSTAELSPSLSIPPVFESVNIRLVMIFPQDVK